MQCGGRTSAREGTPDRRGRRGERKPEPGVTARQPCRRLRRARAQSPGAGGSGALGGGPRVRLPRPWGLGGARVTDFAQGTHRPASLQARMPGAQVCGWPHPPAEALAAACQGRDVAGVAEACELAKPQAEHADAPCARRASLPLASQDGMLASQSVAVDFQGPKKNGNLTHWTDLPRRGARTKPSTARRLRAPGGEAIRRGSNAGVHQLALSALRGTCQAPWRAEVA